MKKNKRIRVLEIIKEHITNNKKEYFIIALIFIIGIFLGVLFINHMGETSKSEVSTYLSSFIEKMKNIESLNYIELLKSSMIQNALLAFILWFFGTTVIGIPIVFGIVLYRGFCLGYTISVCISIMGLSKGIIFVLILLLLQSIFFIPAILALAVSGFKLYQSIIKDRKKENVKIEVVRHTIFSFFMLLILLMSSVIEIMLSTNVLKLFIKYF